MKIKMFISYFSSIPKSLYFNLKYLSFKDAIKLPILINYRTKLNGLSGEVRIESNIKTAMIKIGFETIDIFEEKKIHAIWKNYGKVIFKGKAILKNGVKINISKNAELICGDNLLVNNNTSIICNKKVVFGNDNLISWNCLVMDTDFHKIYKEDNIINEDKEILIKNNVWIACNSVVLKGSIIGRNNIIAANSTISGKFDETNTIYGGNPIRVIKSNINWSN